LRSPTSYDEAAREGPDAGPLAHHMWITIGVPGCSCLARPSRRVLASDCGVQTDEVCEGLLDVPERVKKPLGGGVPRGSLRFGMRVLPLLWDGRDPPLARSRHADRSTPARQRRRYVVPEVVVECNAGLPLPRVWIAR
jgi:hypothetical protein